MIIFFVPQKLPYTGPISDWVQPGMALFIQGTVDPAANQYVNQ